MLTKIKKIIKKNDKINFLAKSTYEIIKFIELLYKKNRSKRYLHLRLDTTNYCNLRCIYCHSLALEKKPRLMSLDEFNKIAEELFISVKSLSLSCAWEPLLNKNFAQYVSIASKYNIPELLFVTNGHYFNEENILATIKAPVHNITVSIDAATKETYSAIRVNSDFDKLISNLSLIKKLKKEHNSNYPKIKINYVLFDKNADEATLFIEKFNHLYDSIVFSQVLARKRNETFTYSRLQMEKLIEIQQKCEKIAKELNSIVYFDNNYDNCGQKRLLCPYSLEYLLVSSNGDIALCNKKVIGNIYNNTFQEICKTNKALFKELYFAHDEFCINECDY